ncbi:MAG: tetratricopeptide repeat protein [Lachnospiraceae bacterium]|nr:tetratricopeptide repeat protein [Lachnospiraceae bacterium]
MRCPRCDANINIGAVRCNFCGQDLSVVHYVRRISNAYYNIGLEKARVRDLSGAIDTLKKSLQFDKRNTDARNLLGLIYYEMGETVAALSEWVLSKYLQPEENAADYYINTVQKNQTALDATNQTIKKYNSALTAAKAGNEDLAIIQLKKVVSLNPHFVRAQQLLALLYIYTEDFQKAAKCLNRARRIDFNNTTTLRYMQEIGDRAAVGQGKNSSASRKAQKKDTLANVTPVGHYKEEKRSLMPVVQIIIGVIIGIAVCFVLIRPTLQKGSADSGSQIADTNSQLSVQASQISTLKKEKENLQEEVDSLQKQIVDGDTEALEKVSSYEKLIKGLSYYTAGDKINAAIAVADCKKSDFDTKVAKDLYTTIGSISDSQIAALVSQGISQMNTSYDEAIKTFKKVLSVDEGNQEAMFYMGRCYQRQNKNSKAKTWYEKVIETDDTTSFATQAETYLAQVDGTQ